MSFMRFFYIKNLGIKNYKYLKRQKKKKLINQGKIK